MERKPIYAVLECFCTSRQVLCIHDQGKQSLGFDFQEVLYLSVHFVSPLSLTISDLKKIFGFPVRKTPDVVFRADTRA